MIWLLTLPVLLPFAIAVFALRRDRLSGIVFVTGWAGSLIVAVMLVGQVMEHGVVVGQTGGWTAPFGITLVADYLSAARVDHRHHRILRRAVLAVRDRAQAGKDRFSHVVSGDAVRRIPDWRLCQPVCLFEVLLICSFGLLIIGGARQAIDGAKKYFVLKLISTLCF